MGDIHTMCIIPDVLLRRLKTHPLLKGMFENIKQESYKKMMTIIVSNIMSVQDIPCHRHLQITEDQKHAWLECFDETLKEIGMNDQSAESLRNRMRYLLDQVYEQRKSEDLCQYIKKVVSMSNHPDIILADLKNFINQLD